MGNINFSDFTTERPARELSAEEKTAGLRKSWSEAKYNFASFDLLPHLNWDSLYQSYIPKVLATANTHEYDKVLQNFYQHLHNGHTSIRLPYSMQKTIKRTPSIRSTLDRK